MSETDEVYIKRALDIAFLNATSGDGPFGCVIVKDGVVIAESGNNVIEKKDPTAHAEIEAIRLACKKLDSYQLDGCALYCSSYPCPQCIGAIYWARPEKVYYAKDKDEAAKVGFDDSFIYEELIKPNDERKYKLEKIEVPNQPDIFGEWIKNKKAMY